MNQQVHILLTLTLPLFLSTISYVYSGNLFTVFEWWVTAWITWFVCFTMYPKDPSRGGV